MIDKRDFEARALAIAQRLFRIAYAILGNAHDCEDAVQQALERAWAGRAGLREDARFETWLVRILINTSKSVRKARGRFPSVELSDSLPAQPPPDPQLAQALGALPLSYRLPTIMHHLEGYTAKEIASMLGLPLSTVKWRLHAALKMLRTQLAEGDERS